VIRNVVLHLANEQPLVADLYELPTAGDVGLRCTNLRMLDGKRPIFVDDSASIFFFPYHRLTFVEVPLRSAAGTDLGDMAPLPVAVSGPPPDAAGEPEDDGELEIDEDFLRRIREV
jgi:hypothetical protein